MGRIVGTDLGSYAFDAAAKTITLTGLSSVSIEQIISIINLTRGAYLYFPSDPAAIATITGNVITLVAPTLNMADTDKLRIEIDMMDEAVSKAMIAYEDIYVTYVCTAVVGSVASDPVWRIKKIDLTSGIVITWCDGNSNYDNVATDLITVKALSYS